MKKQTKNSGSVLIVVVFAIALMTALVAGILQLDSEQIQIMKNEIFAAQAITIAEAGLNDAFAEMRANSAWNAGFSGKSFGGGSYTVTVAGTPPDPNVVSTGTGPAGFVAKVEAEITIGNTTPPSAEHVIRVDKLKINGY
jgi:hypothetical protein